MIQAALICPDTDLRTQFEEMTTPASGVRVLRTFTYYPHDVELTRFLRAAAPDLIFLSLERPEPAMEVIKQAAQDAPATKVVTIARQRPTDTLIDLMHLGVRDLLTAPFSRDDLQQALGRLKPQTPVLPPRREPQGELLSFLPAKPGAGTSTLAVNVAYQLAKHRPGALLLDFDLNCGMVRRMLGVVNPASLEDAAAQSLDLTEQRWSRLITRVGHLDVLPAGPPRPELRLEMTQLRYLMAHIRGKYVSICADLSGNLERYSVEVLKESSRILLVCAPDLASVYQARRKLDYLGDLGLSRQVSLIVCQSGRGESLSGQEVEKECGHAIDHWFPADPRGTQDALRRCAPLAPSSRLSQRISEFVTGSDESRGGRTGFWAQLLRLGAEEKEESLVSRP